MFFFLYMQSSVADPDRYSTDPDPADEKKTDHLTKHKANIFFILYLAKKKRIRIRNTLYMDRNLHIF